MIDGEATDMVVDEITDALFYNDIAFRILFWPLEIPRTLWKMLTWIKDGIPGPLDKEFIKMRKERSENDPVSTALKIHL